MQAVYSHEARETACVMRFGVFLPPQAQAHAVPLLYWLSGLTCTEENFIVKAGAQRVAAELGLAVVVPDTSPRGLKISGEDASYDFARNLQRSEEHTSELQSQSNLVCRLLLEKKKNR